MARLDAFRVRLTGSCHGLTPDQWNSKPDPATWSIAQNIDHIAVTEAGISIRAKHALLERAVPNRTRRLKTAPSLEDPPAAARPAELLAAFNAARDNTRAFTAGLAANSASFRQACVGPKNFSLAQIIPRHPLGRCGQHLNGVALQGHEILKRVHRVQLASVNQAHEQIPHLRSM